jgi:hypothetical protein
MKKIASITRLFLAAAVSFTMTALVTSCGDDDDEPGDFVKITNRTSNQLMYSYASQSVDEVLVISTGGAWQATVTKGDDWLSLRGATSGASKGQYSLGVDLTMNYSDEQRTGEIVITSGTASQTVYVIQDYNDNATTKPSTHTLKFTLDATHKTQSYQYITFTGLVTTEGYTVNGNGNTRTIKARMVYGLKSYGWDFTVGEQGEKSNKREIDFSQEIEYWETATFSCDDSLLDDEVIYVTFEFMGLTNNKL